MSRKRSVESLLLGGLLAMVIGAPVSAAKPSLAITVACVDESQSPSHFSVQIDWANQRVKSGAIEVIVTFKGPGLQDSSQGPQLFIGATSTDFLVFDAGPFLGVPDWDSWTSISASLSGAIKGKIKAVGQPTGGWDTCSPPT